MDVISLEYTICPIFVIVLFEFSTKKKKFVRIRLRKL